MVGTQRVGGFGNRALVADLGEVVAGGQIYVNYIGYAGRDCRRQQGMGHGSGVVAGEGESFY